MGNGNDGFYEKHVNYESNNIIIWNKFMAYPLYLFINDYNLYIGWWEISQSFIRLIDLQNWCYQFPILWSDILRSLSVLVTVYMEARAELLVFPK